MPEFYAQLTGPQKALVAFGLSLVPGFLGWTIPGGFVSDRVELELDDILVRTWPWTLSIALIVLFAANAPDDWHDLAKVAAVVGIIAMGSAIGVELVPEQAVVTESQAEQVQYVVLAEQQAVTGAGTVAHNPKVAAGVFLAGIVVFVLGAYLILYGPMLWIAGIVCGAYLGYLLTGAFGRPLQTPASPPTP